MGTLRKMDVLRYANSLEAAQACGQRILDLLSKAIATRKRATLAVSGGTSPKPMFELFAKSEFPWNQVHVFWVDERCVPPSDPQSNFRMANETWLVPAKVPAGNIHRVPTELEPREAAKQYAQELHDFFGVRLGELPQFDVIHRGMGPDAHTASLFPERAADCGSRRSRRRRVGGKDASMAGHAAARSTGGGLAHGGARHGRG